MYSSQLRSEKLYSTSLREYLHDLFGILLHGGGGYLFSPFIYSVINLYQYGLMNIYFLYFGLSFKAILFVSLLKLFQLWALGTFPVAPMSFSHNPHQCGCGLVFFFVFWFLSNFLLSGTANYKMFQTFLVLK